MVHFVHRDSSYGVQFICRDSLYGMPFIRRDSPYEVILSVRTVLDNLSIVGIFNNVYSMIKSFLSGLVYST